jgi:hypothetical protein
VLKVLKVFKALLGHRGLLVFKEFKVPRVLRVA